ncbi:MAG TPA: dihydroorotase [Acidimicrobiales bacterium]|nr:dihydroorotase [Acidimicrobiales bacterium]
MPEGDLVIRGGTLLDGMTTGPRDVRIHGGVIAEVSDSIASNLGDRELDASGSYILPGLVDLHTHLREPGYEEAEDIISGSRSAAMGGFSAIVAMPNTEPAVDCVEAVRLFQARSSQSLVEAVTSGAITVGRKGEALSPMAEMAELGVRIFTDDGNGVQDSGVMRRAMEYASGLGVIIAEHCEDAGLARDGHMHEGRVSSRLGIPAIPSEAEELMAARDIALARLTGAKLHLLHISTSGTVQLVERARKSGLQISCEVTPHHLSITDGAIESFDSIFKVNPPLRSQEDLRSLRSGLLRGVIDAIATDHAPHPPEKKEVPFEEAAFGMIGLETALPVVVAVLTGDWDIGEFDAGQGADRLEIEAALGLVVKSMSQSPAKIAGLQASQGGPVAPGRPANICVFDPEAQWVVDARCLASRSSNSPFQGRKMVGRVRHTIAKGRLVVADVEAQL